MRGLSDCVDAPATAGSVPAASAIERAAVKAPGYNHEQAVRRALQEGAADESQREVFTQIEEERNTIERIERYVDHQYFLREYVVRVSSSHLFAGCTDWQMHRYARQSAGGGLKISSVTVNAQATQPSTAFNDQMTNASNYKPSTMQVRCVGERSLGQSIEVLQRGQFLLDQDRLGKQIPVTHPVTVV